MFKIVFLVNVFVLWLNFQTIFGQDCESKVTCGQCIQEINCFWCNSPVTDSPRNHSVHCLSMNEIQQCGKTSRENPKSFFQVIHNAALTEEVQISPQRVALSLRKGEKYSINFRYQQAKNYPIDLYYIMDLSASMNLSRVRLGQLGQELANEMRRKTNNFKIGFGSFVDKLALPFVNTLPDALKEPCPGCAAPYSFKNHLSLTTSSSEFSRKVTETQISGNLDSPEGGFDAIMQAIVCKDVIGWRSNSRHLLVLSTDAESHIAGDGKLGGIIEQNDGKCHMTNNMYTEGLTYDYPSVSHINYVARQNNINIIFAIVKKERNEPLTNHYKVLSEAIENSKMGTLEQNSNNVVRFISDIYDQIRDSVKISSNATKDVSVKISSNCKNFADSGCMDVKPGAILEFTATVEALECSNGGSNKKIIKIKPEGLEDNLSVELDIICDCSCSVNRIKNSPDCYGQGDLECGVCRCNEGRFGNSCQCDRTQSKGEDTSLCVKPGGNGEICSGQGECICGKCECKLRPDKSQLIYGTYCECDNFSCPLMCSGRGTCDCGNCTCDDGWSGSACECSTDQNECVAPGTKEICSGRGECICGQCQCTQDDQRHSGKYCEECTSCPAQRCDEFRPCVECQAYQSGSYSNQTDCFQNCNLFNTTIVQKLEESQREDVKKCRVLDENGCTMNFEYSYDDEEKLLVKAAKDKSCPGPPNIMAWSLGVIGTILLAGLLMLTVWKIVTSIYDKREYESFEKERNKMKWHHNENPLYRGATTTFANPAYKRASQRASAKNDKALEKTDKK